MDENERDEVWETFAMLALLGPATFLERLVPPDVAKREYLAFDEKNSRNFLLLQLLTETQKAGFAMSRWRKFASDERLGQARESYDNNLRLTLESIADEQSVWQRKLTEGLVLLINFSSTNSLPNYYHFLLLHELKRQSRRNYEQQRYFGKDSRVSERTRNRILAEIEKVELSLGDTGKCWYRKPKKRDTTSFQQQLQHALPSALLHEKRALLYTYGKGYGEASESIHLSAVRSEYMKPEVPFFTRFAACGLLAEAILGRAHSLTGVNPEGINWHFAQGRNRARLSDPTKGVARVGDFVLVDGPSLGVVEEVATGECGYESYRVRYLEDPPDDEVESDWYAAFDVCVFADRHGLRETLDHNLASLHADGLPAIDPPPSEDLVDEGFRKSMAEIWRRGIGEYMKRNAVQVCQEPGHRPAEGP